MAGDLASTLSSAAQDSATLAQNMEAAANSAQSLVTSVSGSNLSGNPGNTVVANHTTSSSQTANNSNGGARGWPSSQASSSIAPGAAPASTSTAQSVDMTSGKGIGKYLTAALAGVETIGAFLPTIQETVTAQSLGERIRFFGNTTTYGSLRTGPQGNETNKAAYDLMRKASLAGSATSPLDAANAINAGMSAGLLPGLSNYGVGVKPGTGILGGAALASNLVGGIGITGGMQAMATLNQASSVNMLKMVGIDVRNSSGTGMNDLPSIINKVYEMLKQSAGHNPTPEEIAVSMQSGNALDSFLNQYFGGDPALKDVVLAGLMQQAKMGGASLYNAGTKQALQSTGAITGAITSAGYRNTSELQMIQQYSKTTTATSVKMNTALQTAYGYLGNHAGRGLLNDIAMVNTGIGAFAAARGGAGAVAINNMLDIVGSGLDSGGKVASGLTKALSSKAGMIGLAGAGLLAAGVTDYAGSALKSHTTGLGATPWDPVHYGGAPVAQASQQGPVFTGAITIQVTAPPGTDAGMFGAGIRDALTRSN
jgi:hypothetical protein